MSITPKNHSHENAILALKVEGILPDAMFRGKAAFVPLDIVLAMEDYRDSYQNILLGNMQDAPRPHPRTEFARARIYAKSLDDVASLAQKIRHNKHYKGIETDTQAKAIEDVKAIDVTLSIIFTVIAMTSIIGCILSLMGAFFANIDRKRKDIALLRLFGFSSWAIIKYLVIQALYLSASAYLLAYVLFIIGSYIFNRVLGNHLNAEIFVSYLEISHLFIAFLIALCLAVIVASIGAVKAIKIQPSESLRDV